MPQTDGSQNDMTQEEFDKHLKASEMPDTSKVPLSDFSKLFNVPENKQYTYATFTERFERYKVKVDLLKWLIGTVGLTIITYIINWGFQDRRQGLEEIAQYDKYATDLVVLNSDPVKKRMLAQFFSNVSPSKKLRDGWQSYYDSVNIEYVTFIHSNNRTKNKLDSLNSKDSLTEKEKFIKSKLEDTLKINAQIISEPITLPDNIASSKATIYIQSINATPENSEKIRVLLGSTGFKVPAIEYMDKAKYTGLATNEIRYFYPSDQSYCEQIKNLLGSININADIKFIPRLNTQTKSGTIEIWLK